MALLMHHLAPVSVKAPGALDRGLHLAAREVAAVRLFREGQRARLPAEEERGLPFAQRG
ncbi:MAG: hypothetical protein IPG17_05645 [Sandaracinaceae bacterium]|nr:hypothetical protein [Sandaracinaceae bacterium]